MYWRPIPTWLFEQWYSIVYYCSINGRLTQPVADIIVISIIDYTVTFPWYYWPVSIDDVLLLILVTVALLMTDIDIQHCMWMTVLLLLLPVVFEKRDIDYCYWYSYFIIEVTVLLVFIIVKLIWYYGLIRNTALFNYWRYQLFIIDVMTILTSIPVGVQYYWNITRTLSY